jgi:hypothetical protein
LPSLRKRVSLCRMKRLAWLFLAVICTTLVQVQPAEALVAKAKPCACCQIPGACELPVCCLPAPALPPAIHPTTGLQLAGVPAPQRAQPVRAVEKFYASVVAAAALRPALLASAAAASAAPVPLSEAHCGFLI